MDNHICNKCEKSLPLTEFYKGTKKCKDCTKKAVSLNYRKNKAHYQEYDMRRELTDHRKETKRKAQAKHRKSNPKKYKARMALNNAIRDKRMEKMPCESCGSAESQAHHEDYSKPFDVKWLCFKHHRELHGQIAGNHNNLPT
jgi:hypothetical protein